MKPISSWMRLPGSMTALFLAVAAVSVIALIWLGVRLLEQDRALEAQRLQERRDNAADRLAAALEQVLSAEERKLAGAPEQTGHSVPEGAAVVIADPTGLQVWPEGVLPYYPAAPAAPEPAARLYLAAEKSEFFDRNYERAIEALRALSGSPNPAVRAGAQLRLARVLRKAGRADAALEVYDALARVTAVTFSGVPADLVARRARCVLLEELGRAGQLQPEAQSLFGDLRSGRWRLDRAAYHYYAGQLRRWVEISPDGDTQRQALADGVAWLWESWEDDRAAGRDSSGRRILRFQGTSVAAIWRASPDRMVAFIADPRYQRNYWFQPVLENLGSAGVQFALLDAEGNAVHGRPPSADSAVSRRFASATGLPWTIAVTNSDIQTDLDQFAQRRRIMMTGLAVLVLLVIAASYVVGRAASRELAVARLQSDFVSAVSHEFRTPLTSLTQFTEMLVENQDLPSHKLRAFYEAQARATRRLSRLVESLLDFGRMEAGARPYRLEPLDAAALAGTVVRDFRQEIAGKDFTIDYSGPADGAVVRADSEALAQALWNLIDNAVKYSGGNHTVHVEVEHSDQVVIRVRDYGFGIPGPEQREIFRKFARGSAAREHGVKGTGIGLALVKHIVDAHGGKVTVDSEPGRGSTFTITLPAGG